MEYAIRHSLSVHYFRRISAVVVLSLYESECDGLVGAEARFRARISVSSIDPTWVTRPSPVVQRIPERRALRRNSLESLQSRMVQVQSAVPCPYGQTSSAHPVTEHRSHAPSGREPARAESCRPTPHRGARSRQGHTGTGESKQNAPREIGFLNRLVRSTFAVGLAVF
jgi:hypothetical protein